MVRINFLTTISTEAVITPIWNDWVEGECSVTCGTGTRVDTRTCQQGNCVGDDTRTSQCQKPKCEGD